MAKRKYTKRQKGGMDSSSRTSSRARTRKRARSRTRARSRSRQPPRTPIDENLFQHVDPIAMNVFRNTQAIQKIMVELDYIKRVLNVHGPRHEPSAEPQEVDG